MPAAVLRGQRQPDQRGHRPLGAQHRIGQLKQRIRPHGQAVIEPHPKRRQISTARPAGLLAVHPLIRHTAAHGHRLVFELSGRNPKMIKRWPPHVTTTRRPRSKPTVSSSDQEVKQQAESLLANPAGGAPGAQTTTGGVVVVADTTTVSAPPPPCRTAAWITGCIHRAST